MLTSTEKEQIWKLVSAEFPSDAMLRDLHFVRAVMAALREKPAASLSWRQVGLLARAELAEWLQSHPEAGLGS